MRVSIFFSSPVILLVLSMLALPGAAPAWSQASGPDADSAAIKQVCADFSENFSRHDAHGVALTFSEDADFTNMSGKHSHGRADIEKWFVGLFQGNLKTAQRTDTVRSIRYFTPELAEVDAERNRVGLAADRSLGPGEHQIQQVDDRIGVADAGEQKPLCIGWSAGKDDLEASGRHQHRVGVLGVLRRRGA